MRRTIGLGLVGSLVATSSVAVAQPPTVPAGTRVRISHPAPNAGGPRATRYLSGNLIGADDSTLVLRVGGKTTERRISVLPTTVLELQGSRRGTHGRRGALIGLATAGAVGFIWGAMVKTECDCPLTLGAVGGVAFGIGGTIVGAVAGSAIPRRSWQRVSLPVRVAPSAQ